MINTAAFRSRLGRTTLGEAIANGVPEPEELEPDVLIKGAAHQIFTGPGEGKTWVALWLIKRGIEREQTAMMFDAENGKRIVSERLQALEVGEYVDDRLHYYDFPALGVESDDVARYRAELDGVQPDLIVFDSWVGFLAGCGLDENSNSDVEEWANAFISPAKARGCTVVILDHVGHSDKNRSRAASRKKDVVDVQWSLRKIKDFDRDRVGYVQLTRQKDREAWLPKRIGLSIGGTPEGFVCERSEGTMDAPGDEPQRLTGNHAKAYDALVTHFPDGAKATEWMKASGVPEGSFFRVARELCDWRSVRKDGLSNYYHAEPSPDDSNDVPPF